VRLYKIAPWNDISVAENYIIPVTALYSFIQYGAFAKSQIFVKYVFQGQCPFPPHFFNDLAGTFIGSVVCNNQFKIFENLAGIAQQHPFQPSWLIKS